MIMGSARRNARYRSVLSSARNAGLRILSRGLAVTFLILSSGTSLAPAGQQSNNPFQQPKSPSNPFGQRPEAPFGGPEEQDPVFAARQVRALNVERQKALVSDTDKLVKLARELNAAIADGKNPDLTPPQLRKIADIEKLAHEVKQKMTLTISNTPPRRDVTPDIMIR